MLITINVPTTYNGKGKHLAMESFGHAYERMLSFKKRSILIPLKTEREWTTIKLVKSLLYPLKQYRVNDVITIILPISDRSQCESANNVILAALETIGEKNMSGYALGNVLEEIIVRGRGEDVRNVDEELNQQLKERFQELHASEKQSTDAKKQEHETEAAKSNLQQTEGKLEHTMKQLSYTHAKLTETEQNLEVIRLQLLNKEIDLKQKDEALDKTYRKLQISQKELKSKSTELDIKTRELHTIQTQLDQVLYSSRDTAQRFSLEALAKMQKHARGSSKESNAEVVCKIEAQISEECLSLVSNFDLLEENLVTVSGVRLKKANGNMWILCENFLQMELAHKYLKEAILDHKEKKSLQADQVQENLQRSAANSNHAQKKNYVRLIPMTEKEFTRYTAVFPPSGQESTENFRYEHQDQCLYVSGSKSKVELIENQTKLVITREIHITEAKYDNMKAELINLQNETPPVLVHFDRKDGVLEVFGMSLIAVEEAVKLFDKD